VAEEGSGGVCAAAKEQQEKQQEEEQEKQQEEQEGEEEEHDGTTAVFLHGDITYACKPPLLSLLSFCPKLLVLSLTELPWCNDALIQVVSSGCPLLRGVCSVGVYTP
jgi:hypothetical protein